MKRCRYCHKALKDAESIARGIGPVCFGRLHQRKRRLSTGQPTGGTDSMTIEEWFATTQKGSEENEFVFDS